MYQVFFISAVAVIGIVTNRGVSAAVSPGWVDPYGSRHETC
jgi:hypothetical protein